MKKKAISLLLVAAMTATMTAGCGDKQEAADNTTAGNDAAPSTEAAASDDAATEEEEEAWSGTLTVWSPQEDQDTGWKKKKRVCGSIYRDRCGYKRKHHYKAFPAYYGLG